MGKNSHFEIEQIARLARLELSSQQKAQLAPQLKAILGFIDELATVPAGKIAVEQTNNNSLRADEVIQSLPREQALQNVPAQKDGLIQVKAVFASEKIYAIQE